MFILIICDKQVATFIKEVSGEFPFAAACSEKE